MKNKEFINKYLEETNEIITNINREDISKTIDILFEAWKNGKKVITMGNGGSAATASHFTGDLSKTVANDSSMKEINTIKGFKSICLNDNITSLVSLQTTKIHPTSGTFVQFSNADASATYSVKFVSPGDTLLDFGSTQGFAAAMSVALG